jgi:hypothetical protein
MGRPVSGIPHTRRAGNNIADPATCLQVIGMLCCLFHPCIRPNRSPQGRPGPSLRKETTCAAPTRRLQLLSKLALAVVVLVAQISCRPHTRGHFQIVVVHFCQHVVGRDISGVIVQHGCRRAMWPIERGVVAADLPHPHGNVIRRGKQLIALLISSDNPGNGGRICAIGNLCLDLKGKDIGGHGLQRCGTVAGSFGRQICRLLSGDIRNRTLVS